LLSSNQKEEKEMETAIREELVRRRKRAKRREKFKLFITGISFVLFTLLVVIYSTQRLISK